MLRTFAICKQEGVWTELTNLVIPGANDTTAEISNLCAWAVKTMGCDMPVHFSRFQPNYKLLDRAPTPVATLNDAAHLAQSLGIHYVYVGNVAADPYESTYCPQCKKMLIERVGYSVGPVLIKGGKCQFCGAPIAGVWK